MLNKHGRISMDGSGRGAPASLGVRLSKKAAGSPRRPIFIPAALGRRIGADPLARYLRDDKRDPPPVLRGPAGAGRPVGQASGPWSRMERLRVGLRQPAALCVAATHALCVTATEGWAMVAASMCTYCGVEIVGRRAGALYCSATCRVRACRARSDTPAARMQALAWSLEQANAQIRELAKAKAQIGENGRLRELVKMLQDENERLRRAQSPAAGDFTVRERELAAEARRLKRERVQERLRRVR